MATRVRVLGAYQSAAAGTNAVFIVPPDRTAILKTVSIHNQSGLSQRMFLHLNRPGVAGSAIVDVTVPAFSCHTMPLMHHVLQEGDRLLLERSGAASCWASGTMLIGDPS